MSMAMVLLVHILCQCVVCVLHRGVYHYRWGSLGLSGENRNCSEALVWCNRTCNHVSVYSGRSTTYYVSGCDACGLLNNMSN